MSTPITETQLSRRVTNALCRYCLFTVEDVISYHNTYGIHTVDDIGANAVQEINEHILIPAGIGIQPKQPRAKQAKAAQKIHRSQYGSTTPLQTILR